MHQPDLQGGAGAVHIEPDLKVCSQWLMRPRLSLTGGLLFNWATGQDTLRGGTTQRLALPTGGHSFWAPNVLELSLIKAWKLESTNGESFTLTFDSFDVEYLGECKCCDYVKIRDEASTQKFCSDSGGYYQDGTYIGTSIIGPFTGTTMTVTFYSDFIEPKGGFLATICCSVNLTRLTCTYNSDGTSATTSGTSHARVSLNTKHLRWNMCLFITLFYSVVQFETHVLFSFSIRCKKN